MVQVQVEMQVAAHLWVDDWDRLFGFVVVTYHAIHRLGHVLENQIQVYLVLLHAHRDTRRVKRIKAYRVLIHSLLIQ